MSTDIQKFDDDAIKSARELDTAIRAVARQMHLAWEALVALVEAAKAQNIHEALGFPSWTAYIAEALDGQWRVERDRRGEVVKFLAQQGMSQRAISKVTGIGKGTVYRELAGAPLGQVITGLDGKEYTRWQRSHAIDDLRKGAQELHRLVDEWADKYGYTGVPDEVAWLREIIRNLTETRCLLDEFIRGARP